MISFASLDMVSSRYGWQRITVISLIIINSLLHSLSMVSLRDGSHRTMVWHKLYHSRASCIVWHLFFQKHMASLLLRSYHIPVLKLVLHDISVFKIALYCFISRSGPSLNYGIFSGVMARLCISVITWKTSHWILCDNVLTSLWQRTGTSV